MNKKIQSLVIGGTNLLALGIAPGDATLLKPHFSDSSSANHVQVMDETQLRSIEASHLEIYAACKWGHAAFDPVQVSQEALPHNVKAIYDEMITA